MKGKREETGRTERWGFVRGKKERLGAETDFHKLHITCAGSENKLLLQVAGCICLNLTAS